METKESNELPDNTANLPSDWEDYEDDYAENGLHEICPNCNRGYDDIDFDYQSCSKCGWDAENECWGTTTEPSDEDYLNGDADILTGDWI